MLRSGSTADGRVQRVAGERKSEFRSRYAPSECIYACARPLRRHPKENRRLFPRAAAASSSSVSSSLMLSTTIRPTPEERAKRSSSLVLLLPWKNVFSGGNPPPREQCKAPLRKQDQAPTPPTEQSCTWQRQKRLSRIHSKDVLPAVQKGLSHRSAPRSDHLLRDDIQRRAESSGKLHRVPTPEEEMPLFIDVITVAQSTRHLFLHSRRNMKKWPVPMKGRAICLAVPPCLDAFLRPALGSIPNAPPRSGFFSVQHAAIYPEWHRIRHPSGMTCRCCR